MIEPALLQELRRGTLVLAVLSVLKQGEACGADVRATLAQALLPIEEGALYPMLRRLEDQSPVSYTHLDVYKRQALALWQQLWLAWLLVPLATLVPRLVTW